MKIWLVSVGGRSELVGVVGVGWVGWMSCVFVFLLWGLVWVVVVV